MMRVSLIEAIAGLALLCSTCSVSHATDVNGAVEEPIVPANTAIIHVKSNYPYRVQIKFFSKSFNRSWPGDNAAYGLNDSANHTFRLSCDRGEKICYGAWVEGNTNRYWGIGNSNQGCENCCVQCEAEHSYSLD